MREEVGQPGAYFTVAARGRDALETGQCVELRKLDHLVPWSDVTPHCLYSHRSYTSAVYVMHLPELFPRG